MFPTNPLGTLKNSLGIPTKKFGIYGAHVGDLVSQQVAKLDKECKAQYNPITDRITVLNTRDLPPSILDKILYEPPLFSEYDKCKYYPVVGKERNQDGDLEVSLSFLKRDAIKSIKHEPPLLSEYGNYYPVTGKERNQERDLESSLSLFKLDAVKSIKQKVILMEKAISSSVINAMKEFLNKYEMGNGVWYPNDYRKYLLNECNVEMDESFDSGFASKEFFEKTDCFTFTLKEGRQASKALLSFLKGPTVAECGNATMACYYKCILDLIGEEKFDRLFSSKSFALVISRYGITDKDSPIAYLSDYTEASKQGANGVFGKRPLRIGEECHFSGIPWYANKHPKGLEGGWNVIYIEDDKEGNQLFLAHGFEKPLTEREINQKFVEGYNKERTPQDKQYIDQVKKPKLYDKNTNRFLKDHYTILRGVENTDQFLKGFLTGSVRCLNAKELVRLKDSEDIDKFMEKLQKQRISELLEEVKAKNPMFSLYE